MTSLRETIVDESKKLNVKKVVEILSILTFSVVLFLLSCYFKNLIGEKLNSIVQGNFNYTFTNVKGEEVTWYLEGYGDASYYYIPYLRAFRFEGWNPYARSEGPLDYYLYGPIFIYSKYLTSLIVGLFNPSLTQEELIFQSIKWSAIAIDSLSVVALYLVVVNLTIFNDKKVVGHIIGIGAAFALMFAPANLYYVDTIYLNGPLMTFFTLIAFLFFIKEKYNTSG
ncbi:MAG: hypothetical protein ACTSQE_15335, partial [Candidatus Heimdallarchaeaceae archaeon]